MSDPNPLLVDRLEALARDALAFGEDLGAWVIGTGAQQEYTEAREAGDREAWMAATNRPDRSILSVIRIAAERLRDDHERAVDDSDLGDDVDFIAFVLCLLADRIGYRPNDPDDPDDVSGFYRLDRWRGLRPPQ